MKENSFHENASKILELEKEKKKFTLKCEQLQENCERLTQQNTELENLFKHAIQENKKLQESLDAQKVIYDRQNADLQSERIKITEMENNIDSISKEKQRIQILCDSVKKRADDAEKSLTQMSDQLKILQDQADRGKELEKLGTQMKDKVAALEKDNCTMQKEILKLKEIIEASILCVEYFYAGCSKKMFN